jgi:zinc transporter, ZIP family
MGSKMKFWASALLPVVLLAALLFLFVSFGPLGVFKAAIPPIEEIFIQRVILEPEQFIIEIINDGPEPVTIAQAMVNDIYWQFSIEPKDTLQPLEKATVRIHYPWIEGNTEFITLVSGTGMTFETEIPVAVETPRFNFTFVKTFVLLGIYVGVIPVLLGLLWFPFLKKLQQQWYLFLLSLTIGLLVFLGFDALSEAMRLVQNVPNAYNGFGILVIGFLLAILVLSAVSFKTEHYTISKGQEFKALMWGYLIALGIGLHNLGEGLAIGSAYAIGELALGSTLVIGFMIHNLTEGVAIVAPLTRASADRKNIVTHIIAMGIIAGAPTIIGALLGGFAYSPALSVLFLAIGAGAIFDVAFDILHSMAKGRWLSLFTITNAFGFFAGLCIIYVTGILVFS